MLCVFVSHLRLPTCVYLSDCLGVPDIASWKQETICKHKEVQLKCTKVLDMNGSLYVSSSFVSCSYMQFQNVRRCLHVCARKIEPYQGTFQSPFLISQLSLAVLAQT